MRGTKRRRQHGQRAVEVDLALPCKRRRSRPATRRGVAPSGDVRRGGRDAGATTAHGLPTRSLFSRHRSRRLRLDSFRQDNADGPHPRIALLTRRWTPSAPLRAIVCGRFPDDWRGPPPTRRVPGELWQLDARRRGGDRLLCGWSRQVPAQLGRATHRRRSPNLGERFTR